MTFVSANPLNVTQSGGRNRVALFTLCLPQLCIVLTFQASSIILPEVRQSLELSSATTQWVLSANALAFGGLLLFAGRASDVFGHRRIFMLGTAIFSLASLAASIAPSVEWLIAARALQGAGAAMTAPAALALLAQTFRHAAEQRRAVAALGAAASAGGILAVLLGGWLATALGWRVVFVLVFPAGLAALILARKAFPDPGAWATRSLSPLSTVVGIAGIGLLVLGLSELSVAGGVSSPAGGALAVSVLLAGVFVAVERRSADPLLPKSLFQSPEVSRAVAVAFFHGAAGNTSLFFYALFLQQERSASPFDIGLAFLPCNVGLIVGSQVGERIAGWFSYRRAMVTGMVAVGFGLMVLSTVSASGAYVITELPGLVLLGVGIGGAQVGILGIAAAKAQPQERGITAGVVNTAAQIGTAVGLAALVLVFDRSPVLVDGVRMAFIGGGLLGLVGALVACYPHPRFARSQQG